MIGSKASPLQVYSEVKGQGFSDTMNEAGAGVDREKPCFYGDEKSVVPDGTERWRYLQSNPGCTGLWAIVHRSGGGGHAY